MKLVREHINEKFTEDSDPIKDMGIGFIKFLKEQRNIARLRPSDKSSELYYGTPIYHDDAFAVFNFLDILYDQIKDKPDFNQNDAFKKSLDGMLRNAKSWGNINRINIARIFYALKKFYNIDLQETQVPYWKKD